MSGLRTTASRIAGWLRALEPPAPVVDWAIGLAVLVEVGSGLVSFTVGTPAGAWVVWLHAVVGLTLVLLLGFKLHRVRHRVLGRVSWDRQVPLSIAMAGIAIGSLATGVFWATGGNVPVGGWTTLNIHIGLGLVLVPLLVVHLRARFRTPTRTDLRRRTALKTGALLVGGALAWRATNLLDTTLDGTARRFTGSKATGELSDTETVGGEFPVTSWVADDPEPVDREQWSLVVEGHVDRRLDLDYRSLDPFGNGATPRSKVRGEELTATLDCTSGWYTVQDWQGIRVGELLERAGVTDEARFVRFVSVTGYRWSLPLEEAQDALLATRVGGNRLTHGHGAPLRLVAPGRRGFQWVKWVERMEVRDRGDPAQWIVTLVSGFD